MKRLLWSAALVALGIALGLWLASRGSAREPAAPELEQARVYKLGRACAEPTPEEARTYSLAAEVLEQNLRATALWVDIGAEKFLAHGLHRTIDKGRSEPVCAPEGIHSRAGKAITERRGLNVHIERYQLELAARIPDPSPYIVDKVAEVAFKQEPHAEREWPFRDIRPIARSVLASHGERAAQHLDAARSQVTDKDSLGTSAALITAAAGSASDLARIEALMRRRLASIPQDGAIGIEDRNRLFELAYAFALAGPRAAGHTGPVRQLMARKVKSNATFFGLVDLDPKQMCGVLEAVGDTRSLAGYSYCNDPKSPYPQ